MAIPKSARVIGCEDIGADTRWIALEMDEPLGFAGGQFIIVDSGLTLPSGKAAKRAYSPISCDREQRRFELAVKLLPDGPCSSYMHRLTSGAELRFTGPWGKMVPNGAAAGPSLIVASDTGISAALGLVCGAGFAPLLADATLLWLRTSSAYFLPDAFVRERVPADCTLRIEPLPAIDHPERVPYVRALVQQHWQRNGLARAFSAGDGAINYALLDDLVAGGIAATPYDIESFFNMPKKSA